MLGFFKKTEQGVKRTREAWWGRVVHLFDSSTLAFHKANIQDGSSTTGLLGDLLVLLPLQLAAVCLLSLVIQA